MGIFDLDVAIISSKGPRSFHCLQKEILRRSPSDRSLYSRESTLLFQAAPSWQPAVDYISHFDSYVFVPRPVVFANSGSMILLPLKVRVENVAMR